LSLAPHHLKDLQGSGISSELMELAKLRSADRTEVTRILGFDAGSGGLLFEYPGTNGTRPAFIRVKPDKPFLDRYGKPSKYLSPKGAGNRLYIPPQVAIEHLSNYKTPLYVTEGEKRL
jgi:hypothetical protein